MSEHASEQSGAAAGDTDEARPVLRIVKGDPSAEEVAALVTVVAARTAGGTETESAPKTRSRWGDPAYAIRPVLSPGADGWRRSAFPR